MTDTSDSPESFPTDQHNPSRQYRSDAGILPRFALHQMTTYRWDLPRELREISAAGYHGISLWRNKLDDEYLAACDLDDAGVPVASLSWAGFFTGSHGMTFEEAVADGRDAIRQARDLNAETLVIYSGARAGHTVRHARRLVAWGLRALADYAADRGVQLALCPLSPLGRRWSFLDGLDPALEVLETVRHPAVGLACDLYHLWLSEPRFESRIAEIAPRTRLVHVSDGPAAPGHEYDQALPGKGRVPVMDWVSRFSAAGYAGYFDVQCWSESVWRSVSGTQLAWLLQDLQTAFPPAAGVAARQITR